jgi:competence protein ComEC
MNMYFQNLAFISGVLLLHTSGTAPAWSPFIALTMALCALRWKPLVFLLLGYCWAGWCVQETLRQQLDPALEGETVHIEGRIEEVEQRSTGGARRFIFVMDRMDGGGGWKVFRGRARMRWYEPVPQLSPGDRWVLEVRLKRPHGYANPGSFDYERWLFQQGFRATGYVRANSDNHRIGRISPGMLERFRDRLTGYLSTTGDVPSAALLQALTVGDRSAISASQWSVLNATGTTHLLAISGLHISLVAALVFWLARVVWSRSAILAEYFASARVAAVVAIIAALGYALLSGFAIPARRAVIMIGVLMLAVLLRRYSGFIYLVSLAAVVTLVYDPLSVLAAGWWLSFWAVLLIAWLGGGRLGRSDVIRRWFSIHVLLALGMMPLLLLLFQRTSLIAPLANMIAVPVVAMVIVPIALSGVLVFTLSEVAGGWLLGLAGYLLDWLWPVLSWLGNLEHASWNGHSPVWWTLLPALAGLALLLAPRGVPGRWVGTLLLLPVFLVRPERPQPGALQVTLLDVGQGLSVVVQTARHVLVYDTGPGFSEDFDAGMAVVVPFLRQQGITRLDTLVVSHGDNDHIGGARSLLSSYPAEQVLTSVPDRLSVFDPVPCRRGMQWVWDAVRFTILHPDELPENSGNNASCVLRVEAAGGGRVLLTGDIEQETERVLLRTQRERLAAEVLVVPHHGSNTSSTSDFIAAVAPQFALIPSGYLNRYRFPRPPVTQRYRQAEAVMLETGRNGAITASFTAHDPVPLVTSWREQSAHYWQWPD